MRDFTDQEIERLREQRCEIFRRTEVAAMRDALAGGFKQKTKCFVASGIFGLKLLLQPIQVCGGIRGDREGSIFYWLARSERLEAHLKRKQFFKQIGSAKHLLQRGDAVFRQMHDEFLTPLLEPKTLQEHEEAAKVVAVQVR